MGWVLPLSEDELVEAWCTRFEISGRGDGLSLPILLLTHCELRRYRSGISSPSTPCGGGRIEPSLPLCRFNFGVLMRSFSALSTGRLI